MTYVPLRLPRSDYLQECLSLDIATGQLIWKSRPRDHFPSDRAWRLVTTRNAGNIAGGLDGKGYLRLCIDGVSYRNHRVVYKMHYDKEPGKCLDHINGDILDNRPENLRSTSLRINQRNRKLSKDNTSGYNGISWDKKRQGWLTRGQIKGTTKNLGVYKDIKKAVDVRKEYMDSQGDYTTRHGL